MQVKWGRLCSQTGIVRRLVSAYLLVSIFLVLDFKFLSYFWHRLVVTPMALEVLIINMYPSLFHFIFFFFLSGRKAFHISLYRQACLIPLIKRSRPSWRKNFGSKILEVSFALLFGHWSSKTHDSFARLCMLLGATLRLIVTPHRYLSFVSSFNVQVQSFQSIPWKDLQS